MVITVVHGMENSYEVEWILFIIRLRLFRLQHYCPTNSFLLQTCHALTIYAFSAS
jgi:hypothetical protein